jgi:hypothetical protein
MNCSIIVIPDGSSHDDRKAHLEQYLKSIACNSRLQNTQEFLQFIMPSYNPQARSNSYYTIHQHQVL